MPKKITFEEGLNELETIAENLESGKISLEESFEAFERAMKLKSTLEKILDDGEKKIRVLTGKAEEEIDPEDL